MQFVWNEIFHTEKTVNFKPEKISVTLLIKILSFWIKEVNNFEVKNKFPIPHLNKLTSFTQFRNTYPYILKRFNFGLTVP